MSDFELSVRANRAASCKFRDADAYQYATREAVARMVREHNPKRVILLVHGFSSKPDRTERAYEHIERTWGANLTDDAVVGAYHWPSSLAYSGPVAYHAARRRAKEAGRRLAVLIDAISDKGIDVSIMGHSLGTVVMGHAAVCLTDNPHLYVNKWDKAVFQAGDARLSMYRADTEYGQAMRKLGIDVRNYYAKSDSVLQISKLTLNGKRIGRHALIQPGWDNADAQVMHGGRVRHTTYKKSEPILMDSLTFLQ